MMFCIFYEGVLKMVLKKNACRIEKMGPQKANQAKKGPRYKASAKRAEGILQNYPGLGLDAQALWITGQSRFEIGEFELASLALDRLIKEFPASEEIASATAILEKIASQKAQKSSTQSETEPVAQ